MKNHLKSLISVFIVLLQRIIDQTWRQLSGMPMMSRSIITPHIYLGGQYKKHSLRRMKKMGITAIVNMRTSPIPSTTLIHDFETLHLPTRDYHAPTILQLQNGIKFISQVIKKNGRVYVHCRQGEGRGPTMVAAYLMSTGITLDDSLNLIKRTRTFIHPNKEQTDRLKELESILFNKS